MLDAFITFKKVSKLVRDCGKISFGIQSNHDAVFTKLYLNSIAFKHVLTGLLLSPYIYTENRSFKMLNFPPSASVAKSLVELVTPSPWPGGPKFKPQLTLMMSPINHGDHDFNPRGGQMY